jgi:hypothetical protein
VGSVSAQQAFLTMLQGSALDLVHLSPFVSNLDKTEWKTCLSNLQLTQSQGIVNRKNGRIKIQKHLDRLK